MIEVSRLKDLNAAQLFLGFRIGRWLSPVTRSLARPTLPRPSKTPSVTSRTSIGYRKQRRPLFDQMTELYPHWVANRSWLMFGFPQP
jgi:hypothetical protein